MTIMGTMIRSMISMPELSPPEHELPVPALVATSPMAPTLASQVPYHTMSATIGGVVPSRNAMLTALTTCPALAFLATSSTRREYASKKCCCVLNETTVRTPSTTSPIMAPAVLESSLPIFSNVSDLAWPLATSDMALLFRCAPLLLVRDMAERERIGSRAKATNESCHCPQI